MQTIKKRLENKYGEKITNQILFLRDGLEVEIWRIIPAYNKSGEINPPGRTRIGVVSSPDLNESAETILSSIRKMKKKPGFFV